MNFKLISCVFFILLNTVIFAQNNDDLPFFQSFFKTGYGVVDSSKPMHAVNSEFSLYINSFGNTIECGEDQSFGGCFLMNALIFISAMEFSAGIETALHDNKVYIIPKGAFYLRPLYYGKAGIVFNRFGVNSSFGVMIPTKKKFKVELLIQKNLSNYNNSPISSNTSKYYIGVQIPIIFSKNKHSLTN